MNEYIGSIITPEETVSLGVVELLDSAFQTFHVRPPSSLRISHKGAIPGTPQKCVGIVLLIGNTVKDLDQL